MKKQEQKNKTVFHAVAALLAVLAVVLVLYGGGRWLEKRAEKPETRTQLPQADQETVEVDGVTYRKKSRLTTILVMGVDHDTQDSYEYRKAGQADFLRLVVLDDADKTVQQQQIDRADERRGKRNALLVPAGERSDIRFKIADAELAE